MINKRQVGNIFRKLGKKYDFDYYNGFTCCNSCFVSELPEGRNFVYIKHGVKGMNYEPTKVFNKQKIWFIAHDLKDFKQVFEEFKTEAEKIQGTQVNIPKDENECLEILREVEA
jgi:hypothetical protein